MQVVPLVQAGLQVAGVVPPLHPAPAVQDSPLPVSQTSPHEMQFSSVFSSAHVVSAQMP